MTETTIIRKPLLWRKLGDSMAIPHFELRHGTAVVGEVFHVRKRNWHFKCFDGRNTELCGERGSHSPGEAMKACKAHVKGLSASYQLPGICPVCKK